MSVADLNKADIVKANARAANDTRQEAQFLLTLRFVMVFLVRLNTSWVVTRVRGQCVTSSEDLPAGIMGGLGSGVGAVVLIAGALWSAVSLLRVRRRPQIAARMPIPPGRLALTNLFIAIGSLILGTGGTFFGTGDQMIDFGIWLAVGVTVLTAGVILGLRRIRPHWPGMLIAVALASVVVLALGLPVATIGTRFGGIPSTLPLPSLAAAPPALKWRAPLPSWHAIPLHAISGPSRPIAPAWC